MDELFFPAEEHQGLIEPMEQVCVASCPVGLFRIPSRPQLTLVDVPKDMVLRLMLRHFCPQPQAPPLRLVRT